MQQSPRVLLKWVPYVAPFALFLLFTSLEQLWGDGLYPAVYTVKIIVLTALLWRLQRFYPELSRNKKGIWFGLAVGPVLTALWLAVDHFTPHLAIFGVRTAYNPFIALPNKLECWVFILVRFFGLVVIAPIIEELFYRSFVLRFVIKPDNFTAAPIGQYDLTSFVAVVVLMAFSHPEYLAAAVFSAAMNLLLYRTKNLWATIAAHGCTNLCLGIYVICFHAWKYW